jgi:hypothetical protein
MMNPADLRAGLLRLLAALEGRALAGLGPEARAVVCAMQVRLVLARLGYLETERIDDARTFADRG